MFALSKFVVNKERFNLYHNICHPLSLVMMF